MNVIVYINNGNDRVRHSYVNVRDITSTSKGVLIIGYGQADKPAVYGSDQWDDMSVSVP